MGRKVRTVLDPLNPRSNYAASLLALVERALADPSDVARLQAHYYQVEGAAADRSRPAQQWLTRPAEKERLGQPRPPAK